MNRVLAFPAGTKWQSWRAVSETDFCSWLAKAKLRDVIEYHRGYLIVDRYDDTSELEPADRLELTVVAARAFAAAEQGLVHLVQRRLAPCRFSYMAIKRSSQPRSSTPDQMVKPRWAGSATAVDFKVHRLLSRYALSVPLAISIAELAFANGSAG
jgi:hypothetical protein